MNAKHIIDRARKLTSSEAETIREHYMNVTFRDLSHLDFLVHEGSRAARKAHRKAWAAAQRAGHDDIERHAPALAAAAVVDRDRISEGDFDLMTRAWREVTGEAL